MVEEWKRREEALISEEEKQSLTEALIKMLPENGQSYVIDGKESRVDSLQRYGAVSYTHLDVYKRQIRMWKSALSMQKGLPSAKRH